MLKKYRKIKLFSLHPNIYAVLFLFEADVILTSKQYSHERNFISFHIWRRHYFIFHYNFLFNLELDCRIFFFSKTRKDWFKWFDMNTVGRDVTATDWVPPHEGGEGWGSHSPVVGREGPPLWCLIKEGSSHSLAPCIGDMCTHMAGSILELITSAVRVTGFSRLSG